MFRAILAKIRALAPLVTLTLAAILFTLAAPAYADGHHDKKGPFWFSEDGSTQLHHIAGLGQHPDEADSVARTQELLDMGANPNVIDIYGETPLSYAIQYEQFEVALVLLANGAHANFKDNDGWTTLMVAVVENQVKIASLLIANGADVNARSDAGHSAMDWAIHKGNTQMQALLRKHGGECNTQC